MRIFAIILISFSINLFGQEIDKCLEKYQHPISYIEPNKDNSDLKFLSNYTVNKDIISLGESTHGTKEIFKLKHRIIKYLIEEEQFNIFAIEANMAEAELLNEYIQTGDGNPSKLLANMGYWVWNTQEVLDLIYWLKEYNQNHKSKVKFTGFDMQSYKIAFANIKELYPKNNKDLELTVNKIDAINNEIAANQLKGIYQISDSLIEQMYIDCNVLHEKINQLDNEINDYNWLLQNSNLLVQFSTRYSKHKPENGYRDLCMATNLKWIRDNNKNSKIIIWAHNGHVKRAEYTMGDYMVKKNLTPYVIGFSVYQGKYTAIADGNFAQNDLTIPNDTNYEFYFDKSKTPTYFVDLKELMNDSKCKFINKKLSFREIGSMKREMQFYDSDLTKEYDAIINIKETKASELLFKK